MRFIEFKSILADVSIFIHSQSIIIALYIDDMLILAKDFREIEQVKNQIKKIHIMKNLKAIDKILEIHMMHQFNSFIKIDQNYYIQQVLIEFDMKHVKKAFISLSFSINLADFNI